MEKNVGKYPGKPIIKTIANNPNREAITQNREMRRVSQEKNAVITMDGVGNRIYEA